MQSIKKAPERIIDNSATFVNFFESFNLGGKKNKYAIEQNENILDIHCSKSLIQTLF